MQLESKTGAYFYEVTDGPLQRWVTLGAALLPYKFQVPHKSVNRKGRNNATIAGKNSPLSILFFSPSSCELALSYEWLSQLPCPPKSA